MNRTRPETQSTMRISFTSVRIAPLLCFAALAVFCTVVITGSTYAQSYYGKNKVQYTRFDWQVMTTEHFRVYYYPEEKELAQIGAKIAEDSYRVLAARFNHEVSRKIPLIFYATPGYFSQTNVIGGLLPESVGGFTEFLKGRVVVPFSGSYHDFDHVIRHELVHVFTLSILDENLSRRGRVRAGYPPLWFTEGIAEYWSQKWDTEADMIIKDMVLNNRLITIPNLYRVQGSYFMYKLGESICGFIDSAYGPDKLTLIWDNWHKGRNFDDVVKLTTGDNLAELSKKWEYSLKKRYFPQIEELEMPDMESQKITKDGFCVKAVPIRWNDGNGERDWVVYKANRYGYSGIYMQPLRGDKTIRRLIKGERSAEFESLHLLRSGIDANNQGKLLFSSKSKEQDVLYLYDITKNKVIRRFEFDSLVSIQSPRFSPDGTKAVFSGCTASGFYNLYIVELATGSYQRLTNDIYNDAEPAFSTNGEAIVFASDRTDEGTKGARNLFRMTIASGELMQLTYGKYKDASPDPTTRGIFFSSDREGTFNLFLLDSAGSLTRQSTYVTGAFDPRLTFDGKELVYTGYQNMSFQIFHMDLPEEPKPIVQTITSSERDWQPEKIDGRVSGATIKYDTDYSFDIAQSSIGYDPVYGSVGGLQAMISDMLGNKTFYLLLANTAETNDDILSSMNFGVTYINRERRLNWGLGVYHLYDEYYNDTDYYYFEREAGALSIFRYPTSKFNRFDFTTYARYSKKDKLYGLGTREAFLFTNLVSWVYDNSLWDISGPIEGRRYNFTIGMTNGINEGRNYNKVAFADVRHYFRLGKNSAFASRLFGYTSNGVEPERIYFGGSWSFRGYDRDAFYNRNVLFASHELRFPLIDALLIGFPIGGLDFQAIRGALFFDAGSAWDDEFDQFLGSMGGGFRVAFGPVVLLRFDFTHRTDFNTIDPHTDFDFFFGWNF